MPEGPSIVTRLVGRSVVSLRSFGKQTLIELPDVTIRIHLLMFGSYRIDKRIDKAPRLRLSFRPGGASKRWSCRATSPA